MSDKAEQLSEWVKRKQAIVRKSNRLYGWVIIPLLLIAVFLASTLLRQVYLEHEILTAYRQNGDTIRNLLIAIAALLTGSFMAYRYERSAHKRAVQELGPRPDLTP